MQWAYCFHRYFVSKAGDLGVHSRTGAMGVLEQERAFSSNFLAVYPLSSAGWGVTSLGYILQVIQKLLSFLFLLAAHGEVANPALALPLPG